MVLALAPFALIALCAAPWAVLACRKFGHMFGIPTAGITAVAVVLVSMVVGRAAGVGALLPVCAMSIAAGVGGVVVMARRPGAWRRPSAHALAIWLPACIGGLAWLCTLAVAQVLPGAARLTWAMNGDTNNNLWFAQRIIDLGGVAIGRDENAVPLPHALLAIGIIPGRNDQASAAALLEHDLAAFGVVWALFLGVSGVAMGAVAASIIDRSRIGSVIIASATGSLLPLTWFVAGIPIEYGYMNVHVVLPVVLASWLVYLASADRPIAGLVVLMLATTLIMAVWSPLAVIPVSLGLSIAARNWQLLRSLDLRTARPLVAGLVPPLGWMFMVSGPAIQNVGSAFEIAGHGLPVVAGVAAVLLALAVGGAAALSRTGPVHRPGAERESELRMTRPLLSGVAAVAGAGIVGWGILLFLAKESDPLTAYYPSKFAWLAAVILGAIVLGVAFGLADRIRRQAPARAVMVGVATAAIVGACLGPGLARPSFVITQPVERILSGAVWRTGDRSAEVILALSDPADPGILWDSGEPDEAFINFWIVQELGGDILADTGGEVVLRQFAFSAYREYRDTGQYQPPSIETLCSVAASIPGRPTIVTRDHGLAARVTSACPLVKLRVVLEQPRP